MPTRSARVRDNSAACSVLPLIRTMIEKIERRAVGRNRVVVLGMEFMKDYLLCLLFLGIFRQYSLSGRAIRPSKKLSKNNKLKAAAGANHVAG